MGERSGGVSPLGVVPGDATKEGSSLYSRPTEPPSALNKDTTHTLAHIDTFFVGGVFVAVFVRFFPFFVIQHWHTATLKLDISVHFECFILIVAGHQT